MSSARVAGLAIRLHFVRLAPLFRGLGVAECMEVVRAAGDQRVSRKGCFFLQGEPADNLMLLCAGRVKLTRLTPCGQPMILHVCAPGESFGSFEAGTYPASAEALEPSHALVWPRSFLGAFAERHPELLRNVLRILSERMRSLEQHCGELSSEKVPRRVALALTRLVAQMGRTTEEGVLVSLSRDELAQMTGTTLFTVSRVLAEWESKGVVQPRREGVVVKDAERLAVMHETSSRHASGSAGG